MIKLDCVHVDTCFPDYWGGHHLPHIQIPVYRNMTLKQIKEYLRDELRFGYVKGSCEDARLMSADFLPDTEQEKRANQLTKAAYAAINRIHPSKKGQRRFFQNIEALETDEERPYAFFVFQEI